MVEENNKTSSDYIFAKRNNDIVIFALILLVLVIISFSRNGVYYRVFVAEAEFYRVTPRGHKMPLPASDTVKILTSYPFREQMFWNLTTLFITKRMEIVYQTKKYTPNTQYIWSVNYATNSLDLDKNKKFIYTADENGNLIYQKQ